MLPDAVIVAIVTGVSTLGGVGLTTFMQTITTQRNQRFEFRKESLRIEHETSNKRSDLIREKLEKAHTILSEISREFSLTFLTIDWSAKMPPVDFHNKYRDLCSKAAEVQMIVDFYAPSVSESVEDLYGLMNHYWGYFHIVLVIEEKGEKVDHTTPSYLEAVKYSKMIPSKVYEIKQKVGEIAHSVIDI
jgi:hypothetical protein